MKIQGDTFNSNALVVEDQFVGQGKVVLDCMKQMREVNCVFHLLKKFL